MKKTLSACERKMAAEVNEKLDKKDVIVMGFVRELRDIGKLVFVELSDVSGSVQLTAKSGEVPNDILEKIKKLTRESVIAVKGIARKNKTAPNGVEIIPSEINLVSLSQPQLPLEVVAKKTPALLDTRLDWRFLDLRKPENLLIFKVQTAMEMAMREFWVKNGFIEIHSPKFMGSPSESGAELFRVIYFEREAYLAQSPQFYKQMAIAAGFEKVFEIGPVFRANPSHTTRHDTEYTSVDMEMSWIKSHEDIMKFEENWLTYVIKEVKKQYGKEIKETFGFDMVVPKIPFPRMSVQQIRKKLKEEGKNINIPADEDLTPEEEKSISEIIKEKFKHEFIFATEYPWKIKPFYHMRHEDRPNVTKGFDLLWNGLEITTGSQREHRYEVLVSQAKEKGLNPENIKFYLDFFKYGCPPHGGLGLGLTRMLMSMLKMKNVREVTFAFRDMNRLYP